MLPWVILIGFWVYFLRRMSQSGGGLNVLNQFGNGKGAGPANYHVRPPISSGHILDIRSYNFV